MKLSIVILCWNDAKVIYDCLRSIYATTRSTEFEVIVSDNGSTDGSIAFIRENYTQVRVIENGRNLRFAKANNVGIKESRGEYVLILNPDTIIHEGALDGMIAFADKHPEAGAFGCRVMNADSSYQVSARPFTSPKTDWVVALQLRSLGRVCSWFGSDTYVNWKGDTQREVDWISGCFILVRGDVLRALEGFDEQFFYYYEDMDLCRRIWESGHPIVYTPLFEITHLKGESTNKRLPPINFVLDSQITRYLYYKKYYGESGMHQARYISLVSSSLRWLGYKVADAVSHRPNRQARLQQLETLFKWHYLVNPIRLVENGEEPELGRKLAGRVFER
ncbi:MAG: glycosyltransferase family 2 protein [Candidatus Sulfotelmatobacter sp.]|jgi:GT2 family glycosyltransferase